MDYSPLFISIKTALAATGITFIVGTYVAYKMSGKHSKVNTFLDALFHLPIILPPTVVGYFLLLIFGKNGPFGPLFELLEIRVIFTWTANVIAAFVVSFPLMYKTSRAAFEMLNNHYVEAAKTMGASNTLIFWKIIFPLSWPGIGAGTLLAFARAIGEFGATMMIAGSIAGKTKTIPIAIFFASEAGKDQEALIWVILIVGLSLIMIFLMNYWLKIQGRRS